MFLVQVLEAPEWEDFVVINVVNPLGGVVVADICKVLITKLDIRLSTLIRIQSKQLETNIRFCNMRCESCDIGHKTDEDDQKVHSFQLRRRRKVVR
jgi:hypothetical protein